jgi:hypothetical protein
MYTKHANPAHKLSQRLGLLAGICSLLFWPGVSSVQAADRSVQVVFRNHSDQTLTLERAELAHGKWTKEPPRTIGPHKQVDWASGSGGDVPIFGSIGTGTEGRAVYRLHDTTHQKVELHWDNPFEGSNSYDEHAPPGLLLTRQGGTGNNTSVVWTLKWIPAPKYSRHWPSDKQPVPHGSHDFKLLPSDFSALSVYYAKYCFDLRTAAAINFLRRQPLNDLEKDPYGNVALAKLAFYDYFMEYPRDLAAERYHKEVVDWLRRQRVFAEAGTTIDDIKNPINGQPLRKGEYDVALTALVAIIYRHYSDLPEDVRAHVINDLLNKKGPFDPNDEHPIKPNLQTAATGGGAGWVAGEFLGRGAAYLTGQPELADAWGNAAGALGAAGGASAAIAAGKLIPESENHLLNIESSRYLTNQLMFLRTGDPKYDNKRNGMDNWMLFHLHLFLKHDFIEYNARPYQDYHMVALLNLYSYAENPKVKKAARMVLDYLMAKVAVSSNDSRRSVTYRRRVDHDGPHFIPFSENNYDPQNAFSMAFAGTTDIANVTNKTLPASFANEMLWAGLRDYRVPDEILDLMVNRSDRMFFQRFHHGWWRGEHADEAYAASPSYLISSGGHYVSYAYSIAGKGDSDDIGLAVPTTFMPTGQFTTRDQLIQFRGQGDPEKRWNMGVAKDFACGLNPVIPHRLRDQKGKDLGPLYPSAAILSLNQKGVADVLQGTPLDKLDKAGFSHDVRTTPWTFINQSTPELRKSSKSSSFVVPDRYGYYVAVYHSNDHVGFLEAYDTTLHHPALKFEDFIKGVLERNGKTSFHVQGRNTYIMTDGRKIEFEIAPKSLVIGWTDEESIRKAPFFVKGDILKDGAPYKGDTGSGLIYLDNPHLDKRIILDFRDWKHPKREEVSLPR